MSDSALSIPILLGTNRKDRESKSVADWVYGQMQQRSDLSSAFFDVRDFDLPHDDYGTGLAERFPEWHEAVKSADGFVIVTPEYNHGYPGILKSVLDMHLKEYIHKTVALVGVSAGSFGGTRVIESMLPVVRELGLVVTSRDLHFPGVRGLFDESGNITDERFHSRCNKFLDELVWMTAALKAARTSA